MKRSHVLPSSVAILFQSSFERMKVLTSFGSGTVSSCPAWPVNSFARWALFRYGNMLYFTLNGVVKKSAAFTSTIFSGTSEVEFGNGDGSSAAVFYAEELRITKSGRYSGAYSPISEQFQNS